MVGAEHLHIVYRLHHGHPAFRPGADDRRCQLEIDVVEMDEVGLELPDDLLQLPFRLKRVEDAEGVEQFFRPGVVEVHIGGGEVQGIADGVFSSYMPKYSTSWPRRVSSSPILRK